MNYKEKYEDWCNNPLFDEKTKKELFEIKNDEKEIEDRFYKDLEFGTAGLRGVLGAGTNRMNIYTVGKATQGLANYILAKGKQNDGVVIAYDCRIMSKEFSEEVALCLNANGIKTYIFDSLRPIPELSFSVRYLKAAAGVMITASHNPPKYNGYKVLLEDGAQFTDERGKEIIQAVKDITNYADIKKVTKQQAIENGLYHVIGKELDDAYISQIKKLVLNPEITKEMGSTLKVVYTPLHGAGNLLVRRLLKEIGFQNVFVVKEQEEPDGTFPTVEYPNPEDPKAFKMALDLAKSIDADIVLATDPDSDRLGIYAKDTKTSEYKAFNGNMSALLILEYILSQRKLKNTLPKDGAIIKSIVSSTMTEAIAENYQMHVDAVLTGFKNMGAKIKEYEENKNHTFIFAFEESYGCLPGDYARDKDGIAAVMFLCEAAAYYKKQGITLWDQMINLYHTYGYYKEDAISVVLEGAEGAQKIKQIMDRVRSHPLTKIAGKEVLKIKDCQTKEIKNLKTGEIESTNLPKSNVLYYELENHEWCCIRPSGTEPKIKAYLGVVGESIEDAKEKANIMKEEMKKILQ